MAQSPTSSGKLRIVFMRGLLALVLVAAIWFAVILWWQTTQRIVSMTDVLVHLVLLPALALTAWLTFHLIRNRQHQRTAAAPSPSASAGASALAEAGTPASHTLPILSAWAVTSLGNDAHDFHAALKKKRQRPQPDALLCDDRGFPLLSARIVALDSAIDDDNASLDVDATRDAFLRTSALLSQLLQQAASDWPLAVEATETGPVVLQQGTLRGNAAPIQMQDTPLHLTIKLLLPSWFQPHETDALRGHLRKELACLPFAADHAPIELLPAADDAAVLDILDRFSMETKQTSHPQALLLLVAESALCDTVTEEWQAAGRLFTSDHPAGLMPGEAAFGLLCINQAAANAALTEPLCSIGRVHSMRRAISIDDEKKPDSTVLSETVRQALALSGLDGTNIAAVCCDADHRSNRTLECMGAMLEHTPQLDAVRDRIAVNEACGHTGAASVAGSLVAAVMEVHSSGQPALLFNVGHLYERAAAVLWPLDAAPQTA